MKVSSFVSLFLLFSLSVGCGDDTAGGSTDGGMDHAPGGDGAGPDGPPGGGSWRTAPAMLEQRTEVTTVVVGQKIYAVGGLTPTGASDYVAIYDPQANSWSVGPVLPPAAPRHHLAVAVHANNLYILGGYVGTSFTPTQRTFRLDASGWTMRADQPLARGAATAQTLGDAIYVTGGAAAGGQVGDLYAYDPIGDTWAPKAAMPTPREHLASCAVQGKMLVAGGRANRGGGVTNLGAAELYDPMMDRWTTLPNMPTPRGGLAAAAIGDVCYVVGGEALGQPPPNTFKENEGFGLQAGMWRTFAPLPTPRHGLGAATLAGSMYVVAGGPTAGFSYSSVVEVFTP